QSGYEGLMKIFQARSGRKISRRVCSKNFQSRSALKILIRVWLKSRFFSRQGLVFSIPVQVNRVNFFIARSALKFFMQGLLKKIMQGPIDRLADFNQGTRG
ncbi:MAG: hypothetical protein WCX22_05985, partial [Methanoregula sp.]